MPSNEKIISWDPKDEHMYLIQKVNEISGYQYTGQEAPLQQALPYILSVDKSKVGDVLKKAAMTRIKVDSDVGNIPKSIKIRVDKRMCDDVDQLFKNTFGGLKRIQRPYFVKVVLTAFYLHLVEENANLGVKELSRNVESENTDFFALAVTISEMLLQNNVQDNQYIKEIVGIMSKRERISKGDYL